MVNLAGCLCVTLAAGGLRAAENPDQDAAEAASTNTQKGVQAEADENAKSSETNKSSDRSESRFEGRINKDAVVVFGQNVELKRDETAEVVVVIGGSANAPFT